MVGQENNWSTSFWAKPDVSGFAEDAGYFFSINTPNSNWSNVVLIGVDGSDGNRVKVHEDYNIIPGDAVIDDSWNHIAYTRSESTGTLYLNGVSQGTHSANYSFSSDDKWSLGQEFDSWGTSVTNEYAGQLDEVAIWDAALSAADVEALYNSGSGLDAATNSGDYDNSGDLVGYWNLTIAAGQH